MRWMGSGFITSMQSLLGGLPSEEARRSVQVERVRKTMLDSLGSHGCSVYPRIERRILLAADLQSLWYLRSDLMAALSTLEDEFTARQQLHQITSMFEGLLPKSMFASPTSRRH